MSRGGRSRFGVAVFTLCLAATGCVIPYAYPKLDYVPGFDAGSKATDIHAFRVDVTADQVDVGEDGSLLLTEIQPRADGTFPAQFNVNVERGYYVAGIAINYNVGRLHTTRVRLYRPGYQLVELPAWGSARDVVWLVAPNWGDQEKAIDGLLYRPMISSGAAALAKSRGSFWGTGDQLMGICSWSPLSAPYLFAASEYERVAKLASTEADAARLREKARLLRLPDSPVGSAANRTRHQATPESP